MLKTSKEEVKYWDDILDEYESSIGLGKYSESHSFSEDELNQYFTMNRDAVEKLSPEDCAQISYRLAQYAFFIQRTLNREIARHNWAEENIKDTIADEINNYKGYGFMEKSLQEIKHNDKATSLNKIKKYAQQRMDRLSYLANSIKNLSDIMLSVQRTKVKHGS
jgi:flagellar biosynthesis chaperone FliJ